MKQSKMKGKEKKKQRKGKELYILVDQCVNKRNVKTNHAIFSTVKFKGLAVYEGCYSECSQ